MPGHTWGGLSGKVITWWAWEDPGALPILPDTPDLTVLSASSVDVASRCRMGMFVASLPVLLL